MTLWHQFVFWFHATGPVRYLLVLVGVAGMFAAPISLLSRRPTNRPSLRYAASIACLVFAVVATAGGALESYYWRHHFERFDDPTMDFDLAWSRERFFATLVDTVALTAPARLGLACAAVPLLGGILGLLILGLTRTHDDTSGKVVRARWLAWSLLPAAVLSTIAAWRVTTWRFPDRKDKPWDVLVDIARFDRNRGDYDRQKSCQNAFFYADHVTNDTPFQRSQYAVGFDDALRDLSGRCSDWTLDQLQKNTFHDQSDQDYAVRRLMQHRRFLDAEHLAHFNVEWARLFPTPPPTAPQDTRVHHPHHDYE